MYDTIPDSLRSLVDPHVREYDPSSGKITYVEGYTVTDTRSNLYEKHPPETVRYNRDAAGLYGVTQVQVGGPGSTQIQAGRDITAEDIRGMSMREYADWRRQHVELTEATHGGIFAPSKFELWEQARERYALGQCKLSDVLRHVEMNEDRYDAVEQKSFLVDTEVNSEVHKHGIDWSRWAPWRWLVAWFHRRDLGRPRNGQDDFGAALRQRSRTATGGSLDFGGY